MTANDPKVGRPRSFDTATALDNSVDVFWQQGFERTTMRTLEEALGVTQPSLYRAFGSKEALFEKVVARYQERLDESVLRHLSVGEVDDGRDRLCRFIDAVGRWVGDQQRGCLVLNHSVEHEDGRAFVEAYRAKLRELIEPVVASFTEDAAAVAPRTELLVAAVFGLNITARSGAGEAELDALVQGIAHQVRSW